MAFGPDKKLYFVDQGGNRVLRLESPCSRVEPPSDGDGGEGDDAVGDGGGGAAVAVAVALVAAEHDHVTRGEGPALAAR